MQREIAMERYNNNKTNEKESAAEVRIKQKQINNLKTKRKRVEEDCLTEQN